MASTATQTAYLDSDDYPESWIWDEHGETVSGRFVRFDRGQTRNFGSKVIAVLEVDGVERSVWLNTAVLFGKVRDELEQRPEHRLEPGERINIRRKGKVESKEGAGAYWRFSVSFPDRPEHSAVDLFDLGDRRVTPAAQESAEDDIPF